MRRSILPLVLVALAIAPAAAQTAFLFPLNQAQEVPVPTATGATGCAIVVLNAAQTQVSVNVYHNVAGATAAHIHIGAPGVAGGVAIGLGTPTSPISGTFAITPAQVASLLAGNTYVNVHSSLNPSGEIRGQIVNAFTPAIFISEFCADPFGVTGLDTNLDGVAATSAAQQDDEFVEIVNGTDQTIDISNWTVADGVGVRHTFAAGTMLPPAGAIVVFGGGDPTTFNAMGRAGVAATTGQLGLNNSNDSITLADATATVIDTTSYTTPGNGEANTRSPSAPGAAFVLHTTLGGLPHSAGLKNDGVIAWPAAILPAPPVPAYPGNGSDCEIVVRINGVVDDPGTDVHSILASDVISLQFNSPGATLNGAPFAAIVQLFPTGVPRPMLTIPGDAAPSVYLDFFQPFEILVDGFANAGTLFAPVLGFYQIVGTIPASLAGTNTSILVQLVAVDPPRNILGLGIADSHELQIQ